MNTLEYAKLAKAAYDTTPTIGGESTAARAILTDTEDGLTVSFPGTNNIACWLADLEAEALFVEGLGALHKGFWRTYSEIGTELEKHLTAVAVGHSEGAALALIYAARLCLIGRAPRAVFAFEPPRVSADATLLKLFLAYKVDVRIYRNGEDIVPLVPRILNPWQHPAPVIAIGKPAEPWPNVHDHFIDRVIVSLGG